LYLDECAIAALGVTLPVEPEEVLTGAERAAFIISCAAGQGGGDAVVRVAGTALLAGRALGNANAGFARLTGIAVAGIEALHAGVSRHITQQSLAWTGVNAGVDAIADATGDRVACRSLGGWGIEALAIGLAGSLEANLGLGATCVILDAVRALAELAAGAGDGTASAMGVIVLEIRADESAGAVLTAVGQPVGVARTVGWQMNGTSVVKLLTHVSQAVGQTPISHRPVVSLQTPHSPQPPKGALQKMH
jgi:hypothetical protein